MARVKDISVLSANKGVVTAGQSQLPVTPASEISGYFKCVSFRLPGAGFGCLYGARGLWVPSVGKDQPRVRPWVIATYSLISFPICSMQSCHLGIRYPSRRPLWLLRPGGGTPPGQGPRLTCVSLSVECGACVLLGVPASSLSRPGAHGEPPRGPPKVPWVTWGALSCRRGGWAGPLATCSEWRLWRGAARPLTSKYSSDTEEEATEGRRGPGPWPELPERLSWSLRVT